MQIKPYLSPVHTPPVHPLHSTPRGLWRFFAVAAWTVLTLSAQITLYSNAIATETMPTPPPLSPRDAIQALVEEAKGHSTIQEPIEKADRKNAQLSIPDMCIKIGAKLGSVNREECTKAGFQLSGGASVKNMPILVKEFPPMPYADPSQGIRPPQARILLIGGIHGDEYSSVSIVFKWIKILTKHHSGLFHWRVAPLINPDGLLRQQSSRVNNHGVDLNRNFPTRDWKDDSTDYWVRRTGRDPRRFPGNAPLSEPESQWVFQEIEQFRPNVIVSVHAPFGVLDFDGPPTIPPERLGNIYLSLLGTYPGSLGRYAGENLKIPILTIELPHAGILPSEQQIDRIWTDLVRWLREHAHDHVKKPRKRPVYSTQQLKYTPLTEVPQP